MNICVVQYSEESLQETCCKMRAKPIEFYSNSLEDNIYQVLNFMYYIVILTWELIQILVL
jgi:hypothetical protein